jgi:hypothetical protein
VSRKPSKAPYTQAEADAMITMPKIGGDESVIWLPDGWFQNAKTSEFELLPEDEALRDVSFKVRVTKSTLAKSFNILLQGKMGDAPMEGLIRYNVHATEHPNECEHCPPPPVIFPGELHVHRYNEACVLDGKTWDACAVPLVPVRGTSFGQEVKEITAKFIGAVTIRWRRYATPGDLFKGLGEP